MRRNYLMTSTHRYRHDLIPVLNYANVPQNIVPVHVKIQMLDSTDGLIRILRSTVPLL